MKHESLIIDWFITQSMKRWINGQWAPKMFASPGKVRFRFIRPQLRYEYQQRWMRHGSASNDKACLCHARTGSINRPLWETRGQPEKQWSTKKRKLIYEPQVMLLDSIVICKILRYSIWDISFHLGYNTIVNNDNSNDAGWGTDPITRIAWARLWLENQ